LSRFSEDYKAGPNSKWDAIPEDTSLEESRVKLEQLRWMNLEDDAEVDLDPPNDEPGPSSSKKRNARNNN